MKDLVSLIVMLFLFCSSTTNAQSVLGIAFGSSYETVKSALVQNMEQVLWKMTMAF